MAHPVGSRTARPRLEALENRWMPAWVGSLGGAVSGGVAAHMAPSSGTAAAPPGQVDVTVAVSAADSVYDLRQTLGAWEGWLYRDPPRLIIKGNTNRALVSARLTDTELTLSYTPGKSGTATVTVGLTDAAGASIEVTFAISVRALPSAGTAQAGSLKLPSGANPLSGPFAFVR